MEILSKNLSQCAKHEFKCIGTPLPGIFVNVYLGCSPKANKSVFWSELPGTREYAANFFFIMYSESVGTNPQKTRVIQTDPGLHGLYRGPISDNGTSNALKSPLTTELTTLGHIF